VAKVQKWFRQGWEVAAAVQWEREARARLEAERQLDEGEHAEIAVYVLPVTAAQARARRLGLVRRQGRGRFCVQVGGVVVRILLNADRAANRG
jgi:phage terminase Nu1 subunit (DNA packaging protein)